jgi:ribose transport system ATP-binding protein
MILPKPLIAVEGAHVRFGQVRALDGVDLAIRPGQCMGLVGHNGAGKSTLVNVLNGGITPQQGRVLADGAGAAWDTNAARAIGLRCVFQELSLCPNLSVIENARLLHRGHFGANWRRAARRLATDALDGIFPGHGIDPRATVGSLSLTRRQMVEVALAFADPGTPPRVVILDEPTSSLDAGIAAQLLSHVGRFVQAGGAVILISHILSEILSTATDIVVMKDGRVVAERPATDFTPDSLVAAMGSTTVERRETIRRSQSGTPVLEHTPPRGLPFRVHRGEIVGLSGLAGHGQTELLRALHARRSSDWRTARAPHITFVAGDRRLDGVFDLWSIRQNLTIAALPDLIRRGLVDHAAEEAVAEDWKQRIGIRSPDLSLPILSLSGGNQQKVLFARALMTKAPVVLMDDPMRGVDVGTKREVYEMIRLEAEAGRSFVWYSTELEEMDLCDRVYVFRERAIVSELVGEAITEDAIVAASFRGAA